MTDALEQTLLAMGEDDRAFLAWQARWLATARPEQVPPEDGWTEFGALAGRGFGKTRVGAEWLGRVAYEDTQGLPRCVVAPTQSDVRFTCFEGESGLLSVIPPECVAKYNASDLILTLTNGSTIRGFSAEKADRLRGPQHADAWCTPGDTLVHMADGSQQRVDSIRAGDFVLTRQGPRRVLVAGESGNPNPQVRITYGASGLTLTEDHPILTNGGWLPAGQVREGDTLCAIAASSGAESAGTPTTAGTTSALTKAFDRSARFGCTVKSGSTTTGRSPTGATSITSTTTCSTTTRRTFASWLAATTADITSTAVRLLTGSALRPATPCGAYGTPPRTATLLARRAGACSGPALKLKPGASVAASALSGGAWARPAPWRGPVTPAADFTWQSGARAGSAQRAAGASTLLSILRNAGRVLVNAAAGRSTRPAPACGSAEKPALMPLAVTAVERLPTRERVYCLKVEDEPEYFANGILVHNCDELAAWGKDAVDTWDMLAFGMRLGPKPRVLWTTTPKPVEIVRKLTVPQPERIIVRGSTYDNKANLPASFFKALEQYEGTRIGRQELYGEMIDPEESGIIKRSWFRLWPAKTPLPRFDWIIMSLDTAYTERTIDRKGDPDPTACSVWGVFQHEKRSNVMLLDCWEDHLGLPELMRRVKREMNTAYGDDEDTALIKPMFGSAKPLTSGRKPDILLIEDKGSGISLRQMLAESNIEAYAYNPGRADKVSRLHIVSPVFAQKRVWLPESDKYPGRPRTWADPLVTQLCAFTGEGSIKHDDHVDSTTQALRLCLDKGLISTLAERKVDIPPRKVYQNPYSQ